MTFKETRKTTTSTEMIRTNSGELFIISRNQHVETHRTRIDENENHSNLKKWKELDETHRRDLDHESLPELVQLASSGEQYALSIVEAHKNDTEGEFGVKNIWWDTVLNWTKKQALGFIVGTLRGLVKDGIPNMVKLADWLIEQMENIIINQWKNISDVETKGIIKNELNQYPNFKRLVDKMN